MKSIFTSLFVLFCFSLFAQPGALDSSFGTNGMHNIVANDDPHYYGRKLVKVLPDGRIIVTYFLQSVDSADGSNDFGIMCLYPNGTLDQSFGTNGFAKVPFGVNGARSNGKLWSIAVQPDGKIILAGQVEPHTVINNNAGDIGVARLNANGTIDSTFNKNGRKQIDLREYSSPGSTCYNTDICTGVVITPDGHILLSGYTATDCSRYILNHDAFVVRLNQNGSFNKTFANGGVQIFSTPDTDEIINFSALQNGKLLLMGTTKKAKLPNTATNILLERVNATGALDSTFNGTGHRVTNVGQRSIEDGRGLAVLSGGKILVAVQSDDSIFLVRYNPNGTFDNTFGPKGRVFVNTGGGLSSLSVAPDGKIIVTINDFTVYCFLPDGTKDGNFGTNGYTQLNNPFTNCLASTVQPDGKIVAAGTLRIPVKFGQLPTDLEVRFPGDVQTSANNNYIAAMKPALSNGGFEVSVYQNPSPDHFGVRISGKSANEQITIKVMDFSGKVMEVFTGVKAGEVKQFGSKYPAGTYLLDVSQGRNHKSVTVLKL